METLTKRKPSNRISADNNGSANGKHVDWELEYYKSLKSLHEAHRGLERMARRKAKYRDAAAACQKAYKKGYDDCKGDMALIIPK